MLGALVSRRSVSVPLLVTRRVRRKQAVQMNYDGENMHDLKRQA